MRNTSRNVHNNRKGTHRETKNKEKDTEEQDLFFVLPHATHTHTHVHINTREAQTWKVKGRSYKGKNGGGEEDRGARLTSVGFLLCSVRRGLRAHTHTHAHNPDTEDPHNRIGQRARREFVAFLCGFVASSAHAGRECFVRMCQPIPLRHVSA